MAQDIQFASSVNRTKVALDETIQLSLTIAGTQSVSPIKLPEIDGFQSKYLGPSSSVSIVNGQQSSSISYQYILFPQSLGHFKIPGFRISIDGNKYFSKQIDLEVVEEKNAATSPNASSPDQGSISDKIFLTLKAKKGKAYLNEKISVMIKLFYSGVSVQDIQFPQIDQVGFVFEEFQKPKQYQDVLDGIHYNIVEFNVVAYPSRTGKVSLGPAELACNLLYKSDSSRGSFFDDFGSFSGFVFDNFFGSHETRPIKLTSKSFEMDVLPLPEGAPDNFSFGVGNFNFSASVSPKEVNVGDPLTVKMTVRGNGNLKVVAMPVLENNKKFKVYDPQIKEENGVKTLEQVLIPKTKDIKEVSAINFVYFDTSRKKYQTIMQGPFSLIVNKAKADQPLKLVELSGQQPVLAQDDRLGRDIIFIKDYPGTFFSLKWAMCQDVRLWFFVVLYFLIIIFFCFVFVQRQRIETDTAYAKRLRAPEKAQKGLQQAKQFMDQGKVQEFYDTVFKLLQQYFSHKLAMPEGMITDRDIKEFLSKENVLSDIVIKTQSLLSQCDCVRYGAVLGGEGSMKMSYSDVRDIIDFFERI
ncbi:MAG: BatD family protein [Candidatus Aceula lacicola]|nr:BatD family protein [Candidatus Aceula lacicola]